MAPNSSAPNRWAAAAGAAAALLGTAAGELAAAFLSPSVSPLTAVGSAVIDVLPPVVKDAAITVFGTADKAAFFVAMALVIAALGGLAGVLEVRRRYAGSAVILAFAAAGAVAVLAAPQAEQLALAAPVAAGVVALVALRVLVQRCVQAAAAQAPPAGPGQDPARRTFLLRLGGTAAAAALTAVVATSIRSAQQGAARLRQAFQLPAPADPAEPIPASARLPVAGITPLVTPNPDFYRIDTALAVPVVNVDQWRLRVTGLVEQEVELDFDELAGQELAERYITLCCVSNPVGGDLIGNAKWLGWPVRELLARAGPEAGADMVLSRSVDGWTASTPLAVLTDERDALLAIGMNGEPLPLEHGFPVRLVVPGLFGYVSATKWVTELKLTRFEDETAYWTTRGWSARGPMKMSSRIDTPRNGARLEPGEVDIGGVAWSQHTGISAVQLRVDDGPWQDAELGAPISADTWRQYRYRWNASAGRHRLQVRAIDAEGMVQTGESAPVVPDGATGWHTVSVTVA
ncbi:molybdopterin-dependent oxidoreductase [Arthrobacter sp. VKM Ac-2550]|uniref:molybdopterin-dependent oxidoreductase n=1 Tax=Crystallibacter permensis TaxID=1938888 RepID=UPI0022271C21|nr:molybdopterin-dependent oxidoreductase [Arthrobacter sp. VKM Ac-2550]MCW2133568.1 DMSO/TMAO reductase YedYZ, molybdopterin-dependent catalytic subunit [Arthrobacter sp. VKM Ac-2550]